MLSINGRVQEDDVIGILSTENIADLKPLGDRILVEVRYPEAALGAATLTSTVFQNPLQC